ncbi:STM2901 family protein [Paraburkholderia sp. HP33-1]|uniref:STM2901 family protein n=1 Tax=Paraburkholderia sp. HP33-1 TaxID=2883243 RepID=UPI001F36BCCB|nr:hypothetical protein [Paraburkholderia sp. HP33-1]
MGNNRYTYGIHTGLTPPELFFYVTLEEARKELGLTDLAGVAAILLGQADVPVSGKVAGATKGTSVASMVSRRVLPNRVAMRLPMITGVGLRGMKIAFTRNLGAWVGRTIPIVGEVFMAAEAFQILRRSITAYNRLVQPADRVLG